MPEDKASSELFESLQAQIKKVQGQFPLALMIRSEEMGRETLLQYVKDMLDEKGIKYINSETDSYRTVAVVIERLPKEFNTQPFSQTFSTGGTKSGKSIRRSKGTRDKRTR